MRLKRVQSVCLLVFALAAGGPAVADSDRRSTDWQADLIAVLMERRMNDTASAICQHHLSKAEPRSAAAARWAIRSSTVEASAMLRLESLNREQVEAAKRPVVDLLQSYEQHDRQLWLRAQLAMVDFTAAQHAAVAHAVATHRRDLQSLGLERVSSTLRQLDDVEQSLQTELSRVASARGETSVTSTELISLQQNLAKQRAAAYLLRSNLFPNRSQDAIASATQAVAAADTALAAMQPTTALRLEVLLIKAEALYRSGEPERAEQLLADLQQSLHGVLPPQALALQVRIATEQAPATAADILSSYYGSDPAAAPRSLDMDLARLRWLLEQKDSQEPSSTDAAASIGDWLDAIEVREGRYARRRGEAEVLQVVRVAPGSSDVRLLAAEAAKRLREGEGIAAADLLVQAAASAPEAGQAIQYAQQAAAVFLDAQKPSRASEVLLQTARAHREEPLAAKAHLQAALVTSKMLGQAASPDAELLIEILKEHVASWPREATTQKAVPWLLNILAASGRDAEAARFLMDQPEPSQDEVGRAGELWRSALRAADDPHEQQRLIEEAMTYLAVVPERPPEVQKTADWQAVHVVALFGTRSLLGSVQSRAPVSAEEAAIDEAVFRFVRSLAEFRLGKRPATALETEALAAHRPVVVDAVERLRADGQDHPGDRQRLGIGILLLLDVLQASKDLDAEGAEPQLDPFLEPLARIWTGEWKDAARQIEATVERASSEKKAETLRRAATVLTDSDSIEGQREAIRYWNQLAQGLPQGSASWHAAKLATARLLVALGETSEAKQICQFILITQPPNDPRVRAEYEAILRH